MSSANIDKRITSARQALRCLVSNVTDEQFRARQIRNAESRREHWQTQLQIAQENIERCDEQIAHLNDCAERGPDLIEAAEKALQTMLANRDKIAAQEQLAALVAKAEALEAKIKREMRAKAT